MATLKYKGTADAYELTAEHLKRHGVEGFTKTRFDAKNDFRAEVSDEAANKLVELMPNDFEVEGTTQKSTTDEGNPSSDDASSSDEETPQARSGKTKGAGN